jgi:hypothetical protein
MGGLTGSNLVAGRIATARRPLRASRRHLMKRPNGLKLVEG